MSQSFLDTDRGETEDDALEEAKGPSAQVGEDEAWSAIEARLDKLLDMKLAEALAGANSEVQNFITEKIEPLVSVKVKAEVRKSFVSGADKTRETVLEVVKAAVFDSGILEKFVGAIVNERLAQGGDLPGAATAGNLREEVAKLLEELAPVCLKEVCRRELQGTVQKAVSSLLGSETVKTLIDDKFRQIHLHLRTEVVPKAVAQALKERAQKEANSSP